jgi:hypothetical protein
MDLKVLGCEDEDWIVAQDRDHWWALVSAILNLKGWEILNKPSNYWLVEKDSLHGVGQLII